MMYMMRHKVVAVVIVVTAALAAGTWGLCQEAAAETPPPADHPAKAGKVTKGEHKIAVPLAGDPPSKAADGFHSKSGSPTKSWEAIPVRSQSVGKLTVSISEAVPVALSEPGETRWGFHQFPTLSDLPGGRLLVTFNTVPDRDDAYGRPGPAYISSDGGITWAHSDPGDPLLTIAHSVISPVGQGEYLCVPASPAIDIKKEAVKLPAVFGKMNVYGELLFFRLSECEKKIQVYMGGIPAVRWNPKGKRWERELVAWDSRNALVRTRTNDYVISRPYIDNRIVAARGKLFYPDFHLTHLLPDGSQPRNYACWCMVSKDNGRSWQRQGLIAYDPEGKLMMGEPSLVQTATGDFACVIRCSDHQQKPMLITHSADGGLTWRQPKRLHDFGVMPQTLFLENNVLAVSFGRPGVHLLFSPKGDGESWSEPLTIVKGDPKRILEDSCGYTRMLAQDKRSFLLVYSDFDWTRQNGTRCRAIAVRRIQIDTN